MTALPDVSGVSHPVTWPFYPHRWFGRFVIRRRFSVTEHGTEHVPADGPVILAAHHVGITDGRLLGLFGARQVHVEPAAIRDCLRLLAEGQAVGVLPQGTRGSGELARFHRGVAYLGLVSGAAVVPVTLFGTNPLRQRRGRLDIVYGAPYRTERTPWPRTKRLVEVSSLDLRVHMLVALDAARTLTGRQLPGPLPPGPPAEAVADPPTSVTPNHGGTP